MFPNLKDKSFVDISTNVPYKVVEQFEDVAILDNSSRISVKKLLDKNYYDEYIDPLEFFGERSLSALADKIKAIPMESLKNINEEDESSIILEYDPEEEKRLMLERARNINPVGEIQNQIDKFKDLIDEDIIVNHDVKVNNIEETSIKHQSSVNQSQNNQWQKQDITPVSDPIITMFSNVKRNTNFKLSIDIVDKIPRPDFIEMMEDSYEVSIIDYLANDFVKKILENPNIIRDRIKEEIKNIVYKKKEKPTTRRKITDQQ